MKQKLTFLTTLLCMLLTLNGAWAQSYYRGEAGLTPQQKKALERQATEKVQTFQKNCELIGEKKDKGAIKTTMDLFADNNRMIQITNLNGSVSNKKVRVYLNRLSLLGYETIDIESYDCHIASKFKKSKKMNDLHPDEDWYEAIVSVMQRFHAVRGDFTYEDVVERNMTVYARKIQMYRGGGKQDTWIIQLGDITAKTVSVN